VVQKLNVFIIHLRMGFERIPSTNSSIATRIPTRARMASFDHLASLGKASPALGGAGNAFVQ
jgi:hypothetical protein